MWHFVYDKKTHDPIFPPLAFLLTEAGVLSAKIHGTIQSGYAKVVKKETFPEYDDMYVKLFGGDATIEAVKLNSYWLKLSLEIKDNKGATVPVEFDYNTDRCTYNDHEVGSSITTDYVVVESTGTVAIRLNK